MPSSSSQATITAETNSSGVTLTVPGRIHAPIIFVPKALTSLVSLANIKQFLEKGVWEDPQKTAPTQTPMTASTKPTHVDVLRRGPAGRLSGVFHVIDSPQLLRPGDWDRVVAVFVQGAAWQFRGWKWEQPLEALRNVCGFFLKFDSEEINATVKNWNVSVITISKSRRHMDNQASESFWASLERYLVANKPQFCSQ